MALRLPSLPSPLSGKRQADRRGALSYIAAICHAWGLALCHRCSADRLAVRFGERNRPVPYCDGRRANGFHQLTRIFPYESVRAFGLWCIGQRREGPDWPSGPSGTRKRAHFLDSAAGAAIGPPRPGSCPDQPSETVGEGFPLNFQPRRGQRNSGRWLCPGPAWRFIRQSSFPFERTRPVRFWRAGKRSRPCGGPLPSGHL